MNFAIQVQDVSVHHGNMCLFENVTFDVSPSQVLWVQGTNGIGKTTLLRLLCGFLPPDDGRILWSQNGQAVSSPELVAFQSHIDGFKGAFTLKDEVSFWKKLLDSSMNVGDVLERVQLSAQLNVRVKDISAGQKRRLSLARLILSGKPVWIMDEPTAVMDKAGQALVDDLVKDHLSHGGSAVIASHSPAKSLSRDARILKLSAA